MRFIETHDPLMAQELDLRWRVLRAPLGHPREAVAFPFERESLHLVALDAGTVVACVLFHPENAHGGRLFQMAVEPALQGKGLGRELVARLETEIASRGWTDVHLHARVPVVPFWEKLGWKVEGGEFVEVGIPHRTMRKRLA